MEQRSDDWFAARCGCVTASRVSDIMARTKSGPSASRANYLAQLITERLTGRVEPSFINAAMQHGIDTEAEALAAYAFHTDLDVLPVGFVMHPIIPQSGASPDGLVGLDGVLEVKCPQPAAHLATLLSGKAPEKYLSQIYWQQACTGRAWTDFISYSPAFPEHLRLFVTRVPRDGELIAAMEAEVTAFLAELDARIEDLNTRYGAQMKAAA
jgi:putative phage-type endonuclease